MNPVPPHALAVTHMNPLILLLIAAYFTGATLFFLFMFLRVGPRRTTAWVRDLLLDRDFVEESMKVTHAILIREMIRELVPVLQTAIVDHVVAAVSEREFEIPEGFWRTFVSTLDGWYGNMVKKANAETRVAETEARDAITYAGMNTGNPAAMDAIMARVAQKSPILGALVQMAQMAGPSQSRPGNGQGRY